MRKTWALVMAAAMAAASLTACSSSKPAETAAPETEAEAAETEETEAEAEAAGDQQEILVAAAASLQYVMEDKIQPAFEKENPDIKLSFTFDSSGKLQTQIEEGADADVFFSAAMKQMNALEDEGLVDADSVVELLENKIALIVPKDSTLEITGFEDITKAEKIALGDPESVPVGQYSREIFKNLGIEDDVNKMEINEGKNVTEVLASVSEGSNEIGIVYATDATSVADKVDVIAEAPEGSLETPVLYPVGLTVDAEASDEEAAAADAFLEYLQTDDAMKVFEEYGFAAYKADDKKEETAEDAKEDKTEEIDTAEEAK